MTTYTAINPTEYQAGRPITEALLDRLASNPLAIQEGDDTAPKISPYALDSGTIGNVFSITANGSSFSFTFNHGYSTSKTCLLFWDYAATGSISGPRLRMNGSTLFTFDSSSVNPYIINLPAGNTSFQFVRTSGANFEPGQMVIMTLS